MTTKNDKKVQRQRLNDARKAHTRSKALRELNDGADFNDPKYTNHGNYHVRMRAWALAGSMVPETTAARKTLCDSLTKGRTLEGKLSLETRFGLVKAEEQKPEEVKAA